MRLTRRLMIQREATIVALLSVAGAGLFSLAITSALAAPKPTVTAAPAAAPTTTTVVDTTPPPPPVFSEKPESATTSRSAHFKITDAEAGVTFRCSLDGAAYGSCGQVVNYNYLEFDEHCLDVRAADAAGNLSPLPATRWCWAVVLRGGFPISATVAELFAPGVSQPVDLVIDNPYNFPIRVTAVAIEVAEDASTACDEGDNLIVAQGLQVPVDVPRHSTRSLSQLGVLPASWPVLTMPNLSTNQDDCKNVTFSLTYTGQAIKP